MSPILQSLANGSARGYGAFFGAVASGAFESIATATGTGSSGTVTFNSIPSTFQHLQLRILSKSTSTSFAMTQSRLRFNSDSGTNYSYHRLIGDGSTASAFGSPSVTGIILDGASVCSLSGISADTFSVAIIDINDYASTSKNKTVRSFSGADRNGTAASDTAIALNSGAWLSTSAINSIEVQVNGGNFASRTSIALYGIRGA